MTIVELFIDTKGYTHDIAITRLHEADHVTVNIGGHLIDLPTNEFNRFIQRFLPAAIALFG